MTLQGNKAETCTVKLPSSLVSQISQILSRWDRATMASHVKKTFEVFVFSRHLPAFIHCSWIYGIYWLFSVATRQWPRPSAPQQIYLKEICSAYWIFYFILFFFMVLDCGDRQNISLLMETFQILAHTFVGLIYQHTSWQLWIYFNQRYSLSLKCMLCQLWLLFVCNFRVLSPFFFFNWFWSDITGTELGTEFFEIAVNPKYTVFVMWYL